MKKILPYLLILLTLPIGVYGQESDIHPIIFPELNPPFDQVIDLTVSGIKEVIPNTDAISYRNTVVTGRHPILLTSRTKSDFKNAFPEISEYVIGLSEIRKSESVYGVSFFVDPQLYVDQILSVAPKVEKIVFFANDAKSEPPQIDTLVPTNSIEYVNVAANNVEDAFRVFADQNNTASTKTAFVFTRGFIELNTNTLLDFILKETWSSGAVTIGNKASYVKAGMTLGLLPDFKEYGRQLARMMTSAKKENFQNPSVQYLSTQINAINTRTSLRSNIIANERLLRAFRYSYPVR